MEYHVSKNGSDLNCGSAEHPFLTISKAAAVAEEETCIIVHAGEYREQVIVKNGALNPSKRITYKAADGEHVVIKGSEVIDNWEKCDDIYKAVIPNSLFGAYNPYADIIDGDWYREPIEYRLHTGQVYINGVSLREAGSLEDVKNNNWYGIAGEYETTIYADFGGLTPDGNLVEINVRPSCFKAECPGINNITISGFEICHAATQWSPPTAEQYGAVCANLCKGWIIENNHIHNSRCNGICVGRDKASGHNLASRFRKKTGHISQVEVVFDAIQRGWSKDSIGNHIIRNNVIHDCGQTGIVGHLGCAFSEVYGNHIYNIQNNGEFWGHEIAGIKFHAAVDTYIHNNCIHDCRRGMWLDWQAQGSRVSSNLFFNNMVDDDLYIEVTHGPHTADNNIMLSTRALRNHAQGGLYVHNLIGSLYIKRPQSRYTPYHYPHSTQIRGVVKTFTGDDKFYNNIFVGGGDIEESSRGTYGTSVYNGHAVSLDEYTSECRKIEIDGNRDDILLPVYINNNSYLAGAKPFEEEENSTVVADKTDIKIVEESGAFYLEFNMPEAAFVSGTEIMHTGNIPPALFTEADYENADGSEMVIDKDYSGNQRGNNPTVGPFENLKPGKNRILVW